MQLTYWGFYAYQKMILSVFYTQNPESPFHRLSYFLSCPGPLLLKLSGLCHCFEICCNFQFQVMFKGTIIPITKKSKWNPRNSRTCTGSVASRFGFYNAGVTHSSLLSRPAQRKLSLSRHKLWNITMQSVPQSYLITVIALQCHHLTMSSLSRWGTSRICATYARCRQTRRRRSRRRTTWVSSRRRPWTPPTWRPPSTTSSQVKRAPSMFFRWALPSLSSHYSWLLLPYCVGVTTNEIFWCRTSPFQFDLFLPTCIVMKWIHLSPRQISFISPPRNPPDRVPKVCVVPWRGGRDPPHQLGDDQCQAHCQHWGC